uniref:DUF1279 domain-containing protein n=1 Tax=Eucampia antarctica TaxID=49252 RepID=A0A7S2S5G7_9STRA|mmetsp:Transcript_3177/g.3039  ORF Transcript_3177/g.3039 Transcript_3177/m.3039 type:complete len:202 (+) Transcript_3177:138-743(+)|eukprot:CAMPEP_0197833728 /NCGR_PEP_ID=MMETSP1437-20131217/19944_1 /TAXON_ID=49252 ORGANISM="Eucampia antarctica, Strain CCMP1452" /NCGR_SAMPLE_ID=MMETSP1437 /ASSEMBLY_ACC=CAM_ASM_001096 /LENGTH=201 /DNA_ID=CAMNT_0043437959 /DNA_START=138 /DNA_END=743 /DNA_ORIENTATION=-
MTINRKVIINVLCMSFWFSSISTVHSWLMPPVYTSSRYTHNIAGIRSKGYSGTTELRVFHTEEKEKSKTFKSAEETTEKYGLEVGLFQSLKKEDGGISAKSLLAKYGIAYLATSIPLAIVSFTICYFLVNNGVDVAGLLNKVGILAANDGTEEKVGTFAIAYAAHKAASPIRFPPTVILTPVVAKLIGKEPENDGEIVEEE